MTIKAPVRLARARRSTTPLNQARLTRRPAHPITTVFGSFTDPGTSAASLRALLSPIITIRPGPMIASSVNSR